MKMKSCRNQTCETFLGLNVFRETQFQKGTD